MVLGEDYSAYGSSSIIATEAKARAKQAALENKGFHVFKIDTGFSSTATHGAPTAQPIYKTDVKLYLLSTGDDDRNTAHIRGYLSFPDDYTPLAHSPPVLYSFEAENFGLGRLLADHTHYSCGQPASFAAVVYEDNALGEAYILSKAIDWTDPANAQYANGGAWVWKSWNSADMRYAANLWVQVTRGW